MEKTLSTLAGILFLAGYVPYIRAILKGTTKPAKTSWLIWSILDTITLCSLWAKHAVNGQIIGALAGAWIVTFLALRYGKPGWERRDVFCLIGAGVGLIAWALFREPAVALAISVVVLLIGSVPTVDRSRKHPEQENKLAWTLWWLSCVAAIAAIEKWTFVNAAQQVAFTIVESTMMYILFLRPKK